MVDVGLRKGDLVEVRSAREIFESLNAEGALAAMPFMPEMVEYCGRRFTVENRTDKVCDTISGNYGSRRILNTVLLDDLRCDGSSHGGCQALCRFYWNEAWLKPVRADDPPAVYPMNGAEELLQLVNANTRVGGDESPLRYRCQATEMLRASDDLSTTDPRPYVQEYRNGNVSIRTFARVMSRAAVMQPLHKLKLLPSPPVKGPTPKTPPSEPLDLQPGEWVRVKSRDEIEKTLNDKGSSRGLIFDREMLPFCDEIHRVHQRITKIIDEKSGELLELSSDCISLENGICSGERSTGRWFCQRQIYAYWRECWLERVEPPTDGGIHSR